MAGCPSSHQPTRIREETLESGGPLQRKLNFRLRTVRTKDFQKSVLDSLIENSRRVSINFIKVSVDCRSPSSDEN